MNTHASMNRIYRLVWNEALGAFVPASELSRARGKRGSGMLRSAMCAALALATCDAVAADPSPNALPSGGQVVQGAASLNESAAQLDIAQSTDRVVIDWQRFDIGRDATVNFLQPSSSSVALNRVLSSDPSAIYGRLTANGQVFLSNPNGVLFGSSARVDVGGLVATSMQIDTKDFLAGDYRFVQGRGSVVNQGVISAAEGGYLALLAPEVRNEGVLSAHLGTVALAAGEAATLQFAAGTPFAVQVDPATIDVLVENRHLIQADGGQVILSASAAERLIDTAIPGASGANGLVVENGTVRLVNVEGTIRAAGITIDGGAVGVTRVAGALDASANGDGGSILVTGDKVMIDAGASVDAGGRNGGSVLIGGDMQGANPGVRNATRVFIDADAIVRADGGAGDDQSGDAGRVIVYSTDGTQVHGVLSARGGSAGGNGGFIETSGGWLDITSVPDASAAVGEGGEWLIDPYNITIQAAGSDTSIGSSPNWTSSANSAILTTGSIQSALNAGTSVTVSTGAAGAQGGDIVVANTITKSAGGDASLTLNAHRDIVIDAPITSTSGALALTFNADTDGDLAGAIVLNNNLTTLGGTLNFMDGLVIGGSSAVTMNTAGGVGGNVNFNGQVLIGNTNGVSITTGGGNVTFSSLLDSGNGYTFVNNNLTWSNARTAAASGTGANVGDTYLAVITSPLEMSRAAATAGYSQSWLGGSDMAVEGTWRWVTGPEGLEDGGQGRIISIGNRSGMGALTGYNGYNGGYVNWNAGEPNDVGGEDALQLGFGAAGQWNDLPTNSSALPYVRETNLAASPLTIDAGAGSITFNGSVGANKAIGQLTLSNSGSIYLNTNTINVSGNLDINAGGALVLGAANSPTLFADDGSIFLSRGIVKNAGADATLTLRADNDIIIDSSAGISSTSNRLNLTINSNRDASGDGGIYVASGSVINSNGGNVVLGGGTTPTSIAAVGSAATARRGILLVGAQINAGSGNVTLNGRGENNGIPNAEVGIGIDLVQSTIETSSGSIALTGAGSTGDNVASLGISVFDGSLVRSTAGGNLALTGSATGSGDFAAGINIELNGTVAALNGGNVTLTGTGSASGANGGSGWRNHGVYLQNSGSVLATSGGTISLTGTAGAGSSGIATLDGSNVIGNSSGYSGNITLTADTMALANLSVGSTGTLTVRPLTTSTGIGLGDSASGTLNLNSTELSRLADGFAQITIGRADGTGAIDVEAATFTDSVRLMNTGAGSGGIDFDGALNLGANRLWLDSSGPVTQSAAITANQLLLSGSGAFTLDHAGNAITMLAGAVGGNLSFNNGGSLTVGSISSNGSTYNGIASLGGSVLLRASGGSSDLTLQQGVSATGAGTTLQLVAGRNFANNVGAFALDAGAGRWLVWSTNPVNDTRGGLAYDFKQYGATYGATSPAQLSGDGFLYSVTPTLTASLTGQASRVYDATRDATLTSANFGYSGAIDGDTIALTTPTSGTFDTKDVGIAKTVSASSVAIGSATNGTATVYGYQLASTNVSGAIGEITPRTVTAALTGSVSREYDGTVVATLASGNYSLSGVLGGETVLLNDPASGTYGTATAGNGKLVSVDGLAISGLGASNYALASNSVAANIGSITPKELVVTADDANQIYGNANPLFTASYAGFVSGENPSVLSGALGLNTAGTSSSDIGTYAIAASGFAATNYVFTYLPGTLTINPAALIVTADDRSKTYGSADPSLTYSVGGAGLRNGDLLSGSMFAPSGAAATAGTHQIQQGSLVASSNYTLTFMHGTLSVAQAPLIITAQDQIKTYGDAEPMLTYSIGGAGLQYSDELTGGLFAPSGAAATAGLHQIQQGTLVANSSYALTFVPGTLSVGQAPLIITANNAARFAFNNDPLLTASASGWHYGDDFAVVSGLQLSTSAVRNSLPGTYAIDVGGASAANYAITYASGTLEVLAQSVLGNLPQAGNVANNASVAGTLAAAQIDAALSSSASSAHNMIRNGGIAIQDGAGPSMATTMSSGFLAVEPLTTIDMDGGSEVLFALPAGTFRHTDASATLLIGARLSDGSPLPAWLSYDAQSGVLSGVPPAGEDEIGITFIARDSMGDEATTTLTLRRRK